MNATKKSAKPVRDHIRRAALKEKGTSLLELAFLLPILILLLLGIVDVGRYAELSIRVANAARAGAQYGAQNLAAANDWQGIGQAVTDDGDPKMAPNVSIVCYCSGSPCNQATPCVAPNTEIQYVSVNVKESFTPLFPYPGLPSFPEVNSTAQMRIAW
jgi:Flp pilus assembly protein TadG